MPFSSAAMGSKPSAPGANRRMAMWAATNSPSTTPRNGPMFAGIDEVRPSVASVYAPATITEPSTMSPSSVRRRRIPITLWGLEGSSSWW